MLKRMRVVNRKHVIDKCWPCGELVAKVKELVYGRNPNEPGNPITPKLPSQLITTGICISSWWSHLFVMILYPLLNFQLY